jgi:hypothetical protein
LFAKQNKGRNFKTGERCAFSQNFMSLCYFAFLFLSWENQMIHGNILVLFNAA